MPQETYSLLDLDEDVDEDRYLYSPLRAFRQHVFCGTARRILSRYSTSAVAAIGHIAPGSPTRISAIMFDAAPRRPEEYA